MTSRRRDVISDVISDIISSCSSPGRAPIATLCRSSPL